MSTRSIGAFGSPQRLFGGSLAPNAPSSGTTNFIRFPQARTHDRWDVFGLGGQKKSVIRLEAIALCLVVVFAGLNESDIKLSSRV